MILSQAQVEVLERLQTARASGVTDPVYLGRMGAVAFGLVPAGYVTSTEQKGKRLYAVTDAGVAALARNAEQMRLFVREPGISDAKEAGLLLDLEAAVRRWRQERAVGSDKLVLHDVEVGIDLTLAALDKRREGRA